MKYWKKALSAALIILALFAAPACHAQAKAQESRKPSTVTDAKTANTDAYIALLRRDVRQEKAEIMGAMMVLNAQDSAKFSSGSSAADNRFFLHPALLLTAVGKPTEWLGDQRNCWHFDVPKGVQQEQVRI